MTITLPPHLSDASASEKLAWVVLSESGPLTAAELCEQTGLKESHIYALVSKLQRKDVVGKRPDPEDPRRHLFYASYNSKAN